MVMQPATRYLCNSRCGSRLQSPPSRPGRAADAVSGGVLASYATLQTRVISATLRDGGDLGALLCRKPLVVGGTTTRLASRMASQIAPVADAKLM